MNKAFIFDIDDTIYDQQQAFQRAFENQRIPESATVDCSHLYKLTREYGDETFRDGFDQSKLRSMQIHRIRRALQDYAIVIDDQQALNFQLDFEKFQKEIQLFPEVKQLFDNLVSQKKIVGIITNGTKEKQTHKIQKLELSHWISPGNMLVSEEVGISKPNISIFKALEDKLPVAKENIYYIGDNFLNDIIGAQSAGWKTVWANYREHEAVDETVIPDYVVESPRELLKTVSVLAAK
ncbi:HAD family hydrolase [Enterococcus sp. 669A]|uniref:HAD family hydrolase n=1 Tax=Candidatus Enterococcus moelleringii TaxID=2815325 RepID=A0ABS3L7N0_9ENTE|nr:HAD family hydrolase [Enterococcus sp. 669A]MBO1305636.1 HAD family hydrolase [Enterococcus sp. 669A]